ncbi:glyoxalase III HchA [Shinella sp. NM-101]|uniref:glyoxalase III HchA n=1 Tax=Shinella sp. NM-101 TaxID=2744455 RepID=UPI001F29951A|nr:glyoxalase III HchA [Shinella sp. NM-101]
MSYRNVSDKKPQPDPAEENAFFPSIYSLSQFTSPKSDLGGADYPTPYRGAKKILMIGADERYLLTDNGSFFSTGNHPVETLLPMYHLDKAGFAFDVATVSGNPVKFEFWAMPSEDDEVKGFFARYHPQFKQPRKLADVIAGGLDGYAAIFVPGGHGALIGIPGSRDVGAALEWAAANDRFVISLCHGPAAFLAVGDSDIYRGFRICAFPDALDATTPDIGYMPGHLTWKFGEKLKTLGFEIVNDGITGAVHRDRTLITGDSPLAGNNLGKLAAETLLKEVTA